VPARKGPRPQLFKELVPATENVTIFEGLEPRDEHPVPPGAFTYLTYNKPPPVLSS